MKTNNWRIAGRVLGVVAFLIVAIAKDPVSGFFSGLFWWGILEFIGWLVDRTDSGQSVVMVASETAGPSERPLDPQVVLNSADELIAYEEHKKREKELESARKAEMVVREAEVAAMEEEAASQKRRDEHDDFLPRQREENKQRLDFERKRTRLSTIRTKAALTAFSYMSLLIIILCAMGLPIFFLGAQFYRDKTENQKLAALVASEAESKLATQQAKVKATMLAKQESLEEQGKLDALAEKHEASRRVEEARLQLARVSRERIEVEREVVMMARTTPLVDIHDVPSDAELVGRERLLPSISAERIQIEQKILLEMHRTHAEQKAKIQDSDNEPKAKLQKLEKLDDLLQQAKQRVSKTPLHLLKRYLSSSS